MKNYYTYVYAHTLTGFIHDDVEHKAMGHLENDCYKLKESDVSGQLTTAEEVDEWQKTLNYDIDTGKYEPLDTIQLDKDYNAWLSKRQLELYGEESNGKE